MVRILGISAFYHDSAVALIVDGVVKYAVQEERFSRKKHDASFPKQSLTRLLDQEGIKLSELDAIVFYDKPFLKFERLLETVLFSVPKGFKQFVRSMPIWLKEKLFLKTQLIREFKSFDPDFSASKLKFSEHHYSHAASAYYPSPFCDAVVLTLDGVGEWACGSVCIGNGANLTLKKEMMFPHSLGLLYSAFTFYAGFKVNSGEYKLMGLAPYGTPKYVELITKNLLSIKNDGSFTLNMRYFDFAHGLTMTNKRFHDLFGAPPRVGEEEQVPQFYMDVAASIQCVTETIILKICKSLAQEFESKNLCLAGGVALNCVANGKIVELGLFDNVWIQPASGDAGGSIGCALAYYYNHVTNDREIKQPDGMQGSFLGPAYSRRQTAALLENLSANFSEYEPDAIYEMISDELSQGKIVGWFQGRMEFGPRALGSRSIIADPRVPDMQKRLNLKIKFRESFRPFAPAVLEEFADQHFKVTSGNQYMLLVHQLLENKWLEYDDDPSRPLLSRAGDIRSHLPAVTHVDYSARVQIVSNETNPVFYKLISSFYRRTGCPVLINTSFNVRGEPIVESPIDAFKCFMGTDMDILVINNCVMYKGDQNSSLATSYHQYLPKD